MFPCFIMLLVEGTPSSQHWPPCVIHRLSTFWRRLTLHPPFVSLCGAFTIFCVCFTLTEYPTRFLPCSNQTILQSQSLTNPIAPWRCVTRTYRVAHIYVQTTKPVLGGKGVTPPPSVSEKGRQIFLFFKTRKLILKKNCCLFGLFSIPYFY